MQPLLSQPARGRRIGSVTIPVPAVTSVFISVRSALFLFIPMLFLSPLLLIALFLFTLLLLIALALFAFFLPLLVRFEVPAAVAVMIAAVVVVLFVAIVSDPLELVLT